MRVLFIAAVLGILVQPAFAFNQQDCRSIYYLAHHNYKFSNDRRENGSKLAPSIATNEEDEESFFKEMGWADELLERTSHYANVYLAFCKD